MEREKNGKNYRLWSNKSIMPKLGNVRLKHWEKPEPKYFYLYDENGEKIYESQREFSDCKRL